MEPVHLTFPNVVSPLTPSARLESLRLDELREKGIVLAVKRFDLIHPFISGNKFYKLSYNFQEIKRRGSRKILTFGGAYSNHILATAYAGRLLGLSTLGLIRGEELGEDLSKTLCHNSALRTAAHFGMDFRFLDREQYRRRNADDFIQNLRNEHLDAYILPEGGTNALAVKGCEKILDEDAISYDHLCVPMGTGGTFCGLLRGAAAHQTVLGFPVLRASAFLQSIIPKYTDKKNYRLIERYHFGGFAKVSARLINFIDDFRRRAQIPLDPVYTGKMMYGLLDMVREGYFKRGARILAFHTGGLQGAAGLGRMRRSDKNTQST